MARPAQRGVNGGSGRYTQFAWTLKRPLRHRRVVVNELFGRDHGIRRKRIMVPRDGIEPPTRSEEHTSELQSLMRISYAVFCLKKKIKTERHDTTRTTIEK